MVKYTYGTQKTIERARTAPKGKAYVNKSTKNSLKDNTIYMSITDFFTKAFNYIADSFKG